MMGPNFADAHKGGISRGGPIITLGPYMIHSFVLLAYSYKYFSTRNIAGPDKHHGIVLSGFGNRITFAAQPRRVYYAHQLPHIKLRNEGTRPPKAAVR